MSRPVSVIGGGAIGVGWAVAFVAAGFEVHLHEANPERRQILPELVAAKVGWLAESGLVQRVETAELLTLTDEIEQATTGADMVVESVSETREAKVELFNRLDQIVPQTVPIASSSSSLTISQIASQLAGRERCLLLHPANPPYLIPIVEVAPAPFTSQQVVELATGLLLSAGMAPIEITREIEGLAFNRLQGALLREAYCLVRDGVLDPADVDRLVADGLGRRWAVVGPFATAHLNTEGGVAAHAGRLGEAYARMGTDRGQSDPWTPELVAKVAEDLDMRLPQAERDQHIWERDRALLALARLFSEVERPGEGTRSHSQ